MPYLLSLMPILLLIVLSMTKGVRPAVLVGLVVTIGLFFYWGASFSHFLATMGVSLLTTVNILLIVLGAAFLYTIMQHTGLITRISHSLDNLHPSREIRFFLLAIGLTAFFEGVAGFGTPGAIVPLILMALGFEAVLAVSVVLLFDGLFATFGAVGTPLLTGLQLPLGLNAEQVWEIALAAATLIVGAGGLILLLVFRLVAREHGPLAHRREVAVVYGFFAVPFVLCAWYVPELATVLAGLLLLPKVAGPLQRWIGWELAFPNLCGTDIRGAIKPLQSPLIPFVVVGLGVAFFRKSKSLHLAEPLRKSVTVLVVLFPSVAIAQLMIYSGVTQLSMVQYLAELLSRLGPAYVVFAPFVGIMGAFVTGSTTISNLVFGPSQAAAAVSLGLDLPLLLAQQLAGASLGNAICLFNIIAAASIASLQNYRGILANNLLPTLLAGLLVGGLGLVLLLLG